MVYSLRSACFCTDGAKDSAEFFSAEKRVSEGDLSAFFGRVIAPDLEAFMSDKVSGHKKARSLASRASR